MAEDDLTDEARAEIARAVAIVREDKQYAAIRDIHTRTTPTLPTPPAPPEPPAPPAPPAPKPDPTPPPPKPKNEPLPPKKGLWWGDRVTSNEPDPQN